MKRHVAAATLSVAATVIWPLQSGADTAGPAETLIVTATRSPTPLGSVLAPVTVIDRDMLARSLAPDITDLLQFNAGIDVARNGGVGQSTSVFIRGADSNQTLVLLDGVRMNPGTIGSAALQNIPPELVERIEVVRGPRSTLYGSDAIGGVINVITRRAPPGTHFEARAGVGSFDSREGSLVASQASETNEFGASVSWIDSDGFPTRTLDDVDRGFENLAWNGYARTTVGAFDLAVRHWQAEGTAEYSDFFLTPLDQDFRNAVSSVTLTAQKSAWRTRLTASRMEDRIEQNESPDRLETQRYALDWQNDFELRSGHRLTAGLLWQDEDADSVSFGQGFDARTTIGNAYLQDVFTLGRHSFLLALGYTDHESFGGHTTWNLDYGYAIGEGTRITLAAGTAFRAPDATDRYGFGGNPDLAPEESTSIEVGVRHDVDARQALSVTVFQNDIDDLIEYVVFDPETFAGELRNVDRARIRGIEAAWEYDGESWQVRAQASLHDPENLTTGAQLLRRARKSATLGVVRSLGPVSLGLDVLYAGDREDFGFPEPVTLSAYTVANLSATLQLSKSVTLLTRVENLFDEQYELASTYNTPDRSFFVALRYGGR